jgi:hypothetical protein
MKNLQNERNKEAKSDYGAIDHALAVIDVERVHFLFQEMGLAAISIQKTETHAETETTEHSLIFMDDRDSNRTSLSVAISSSPCRYSKRFFSGVPSAR